MSPGVRPDSAVVIVDAVLPPLPRDKPAAIRMDLHMLLLLGARERTETEFRDLAAGAGFAVKGVTLTASPAGLGVVELRLARESSVVDGTAGAAAAGDRVAGDRGALG